MRGTLGIDGVFRFDGHWETNVGRGQVSRRIGWIGELDGGGKRFSICNFGGDSG